MKRRSTLWVIPALLAGMVVGAPCVSRAAFSITINGTTLTAFGDGTFINIAGTYGDLQVVNNVGATARVFFTDTAQSESLVLTDAIFINRGLAQFFTITFLRDFTGLFNGPVQASVAIDGSFATGSGAGTLGQNTGLNFDGTIEGNRIDDTLSVDVSGMASGTSFNESGMDRRSLLGPRQLAGELDLTLGANERLGLPGSAQVAIIVAEPSSFLMFGLVLPGLLGYTWRRGWQDAA